MSCDKINFGIVQGRLIQPPTNQLQWFPQKDWESEFFVAAAIGLNYIELIAERQHNPINPLWTKSGIERIIELVSINKLSTYGFCNDYIIDNKLSGSKSVLEQNLLLLEQGSLLGCKKYILPLFEYSELSLDNVYDFLDPLRIIGDKAAELGIQVCLETILNGLDLMEALSIIDHQAIKVVYDTGNRVAFGHDLKKDIILLGDKISHIHIKDKNANNENVILGTGLVNFKQVFEALASIDYAGAYTFETNRGNDPLRTANYNMELVKFFHMEGFAK